MYETSQVPLIKLICRNTQKYHELLMLSKRYNLSLICIKNVYMQNHSMERRDGTGTKRIPAETEPKEENGKAETKTGLRQWKTNLLFKLYVKYNYAENRMFSLGRLRKKS